MVVVLLVVVLMVVIVAKVVVVVVVVVVPIRSRGVGGGCGSGDYRIGWSGSGSRYFRIGVGHLHGPTTDRLCQRKVPAHHASTYHARPHLLIGLGLRVKG